MAQNTLFKELIKQVSCEAIKAPSFTQDDLDKVKACISNVTPPPRPPLEIPAESDEINCVPAATEQVKQIIATEQKKMPIAIRKSIVKAKVQEVKDNLVPIKAYFDARYDFYTATIEAVEPFTLQYRYWTDEFNRLKALADSKYLLARNQYPSITPSQALAITAISSAFQSPSAYSQLIIDLKADLSNFDYFYQSATFSSQILNPEAIASLASNQPFKNWMVYVKAAAAAYLKMEVAISAAANAQNQKIQTLAPLTGTATSIKLQLQQAFQKISNQLIVSYSNNGETINGLTVPGRTLGVTLRLIDQQVVKTKLPVIHDDGTTEQVDAFLPIKDSQDLTENIFDKQLSCFKIFNVNKYDPESPLQFLPGTGELVTQEESDYAEIPGLLYNGKIDGSDYEGLYNKLAKPITKLFTLEERGLTTNPNQIDPILQLTKDAPVSIKQDEIQFYIANQKTYEKFFEKLDTEYPKRLKNELEEVYPGEIAGPIADLKLLAQREAAQVFRAQPNTFLGFARPTSYTSNPGSNIYTTATFEYSEVNQFLSERLEYYTRAKQEVDELFAMCEAELMQLQAGIEENSMTEAKLSKLILEIPCFAAKKPKQDPDCEAKTLAKLGKDPLAIRTLGGNDGSLPDYTSMCYWREFTKSLNKVSLLPFPDLSGPPPANLAFRYWPISCILPVGVGLALIPLPQKFKPLFVLPTPLGTLVCLLTMPAAPIGIPLPSVHLFYFAPDTSKYLIASPNFPLLFSDPSAKTLKFGFELDESPASINPLGLNPANAYKGQFVKGSIQVPVAVQAAIEKSKRLAEIAALIARGEIPDILPGAYEEILSLLSIPQSKEFSLLVKEFQKDANRQIDRLGDMQTTAIENLKIKLQQIKQTALDKTLGEKDPATREKTRNEINDLLFYSQLTVNDAVAAAQESFEKWFDNIKFGTLTYPKDATKHNPELPKWAKATLDLIEAYARGEFEIESTTLNKKLKKVISQIDIKKFVKKTEFNLDLEEDLLEFKDALKTLAKKGIDYLKGDDVDTQIDEGLSKEEQEKQRAAAKAIQENVAKYIKLTKLAVSIPIPVPTFDLAKPCCSTPPPPEPLIDPAITAAFLLITSLIEALIDSMNADDIIKSLGLPNGKVSAQIIFDYLDSILASMPEVPFPDPASIIDIYKHTVLPVLTATSLPKAPNPLHSPAIPIIIPLDPILKPLIKVAIALLLEAIIKLLFRAGEALTDSAKKAENATQANSSQRSTKSVRTDSKLLTQIFTEACGDSGMTATLTMTTSLAATTSSATASTATASSSTASISITTPDGFKFTLPEIPQFAIDIFKYFELLSSADLIEFIRLIINKLFDQFLNPIATIADTISAIAKAIDSSSYQTIEAGIPQLSILKLIKMKLESEIPQFLKLKVISPEINALIKLSIIPALTIAEPVLAPTAWIGVLALCAFAPPPTYNTVTFARAIHPILNQDDLPPWERLTHKNPLFAIFLDEIAWRTSIYSTGSLIFQTKTPAVLPYTPIFPIVHISPHLAG